MDSTNRLTVKHVNLYRWNTKKYRRVVIIIGNIL